MFESKFIEYGDIALPDFSGTRVMMMPLIMGDVRSIPEILAHYRDCIVRLWNTGAAPQHKGVGYITIDEKLVKANTTHRRAGLHVDGIYQGRSGGWGGGGGWGSKGMLTVSSPAGCVAYNQTFDGYPGWEGECDHLEAQCVESAAKLFESGRIYWVDGMCVHASVPQTKDTPRQFVRLSMPSESPWFEGYTTNPLGVLPEGPILPRRIFMDMQ